MSDQGEKTCPICTEEMDLTDQQLKPCKCGYQICVWCWHHIMDMAEKDGTEGRCPACRSPYNKEKIVGMAANCGRLVAEVNIERKMKAQKAKSKTAEGRKQLSSVRVIQRNLVYIVGLPLNLADEDLLQRKEYFGQYGKVLKVSISRTAAGAIQHFANSTCSVYITYSMEEEAVRCIQSVHGFVMDERSLRACFGTTKYCHSWLRNVPCSNPECLYLHEIGLQEDCFSKDEMISAYTRSRVQQISGATNNVQRSGNMLPPPADEYCINSFASPGKPTSRIGSNNSASCTRGSPPNSSSGQVAALPAAASWATRASSCQPPSATIACSDGISKQKPDTGNGSVPFSTAVAGTTGVPLLPDAAGKKRVSDELGWTALHNSKQEPLYPVRQYGSNNRLRASQALEDKDASTSVKANLMNLSDRSGQTPDLDEVMSTSMNGNILKLCSDMESMNVDERLGEEQCDAMRPNVSLAYDTLVGPNQNQVLPKCYPYDTCDISVSREESSRNIISVAREQSDQGLVPRAVSTHTDTQTSFPEVEEDLRFFAEQRFEDPEVGSRTSFICNSSPSPHLCSQPRAYTLQQNGPIGSTIINLEPQILDTKVEIGLLQCASSTPAVCNGYHTITSSFDTHRPYEHSYIPSHDLNKPHVGRFEDEAAHVDQNAALDLGERIIISNMLSMDFDALDEPMAPTQNFAKLMGDTDKPESHLNLSNSWKVHNNNQSRFSFAREEQSIDQISEVEQSFSITGQVPKNLPLSCFTENSGLDSSTLHEYNRLYALNYENSDNCTGSLSHTFNKLSVSRGQVSAPPGFSLPNKTPPPGFASQDRMEPSFNSFSDNYHLLDSSMLRNPYQAPSMGINDGAGDIEFMDPAILAVGKGRLPSGLNNATDLDGSNFRSHLTAFENEARMQLMMQSSLSPLQNRRFADMDGSFSQLRDSYRFPSGIMEQTLASNLSHFSQLSGQQSGTALMPNGHWDGWSESRSPHDLGMAEVLRNEILGFNKLYNGYEDSKFRLPSSGDLYGRTYGI